MNTCTVVKNTFLIVIQLQQFSYSFSTNAQNTKSSDSLQPGQRRFISCTSLVSIYTLIPILYIYNVLSNSSHHSSPTLKLQYVLVIVFFWIKGSYVDITKRTIKTSKECYDMVITILKKNIFPLFSYSQMFKTKTIENVINAVSLKGIERYTIVYSSRKAF